jgi:hypothetical protein
VYGRPVPALDPDMYLSALLRQIAQPMRENPQESAWGPVAREAWAMGRATGSMEVLLAMGLLGQDEARGWHERFSREIYGSRRAS